ncbi:MAG TPA: DUF2911 domain-containing protein [Longimicrobiales bacterium]|nr:DUF2911 domain-containing protein [Longimicrobiales bacterium]
MKGSPSFAAVSVIALAAACAPADQASDAGAEADAALQTYVEMLGTDTMAIERFRREADRIEGTLVVRAPMTEVHTYTAELGGDGSVTRLSGTIAVPGTNAGARPDRSYEAVVRGDSVDIETVSGVDTTRTTMAMPEAAMPVPPRTPAPPSFLALAADRLPDQAAEAPLALINPFANGPTRSGLVRGADGSVGVLYFGNPLLVSREADGTIRVSGRETTMRIEIAPADGPLDVLALADDFAARDAAGTGIGVPSPADTASGTVAGADLEIAYSQPAVRGREVWGGLVPFGEVWRTGANAATTFSTSADIVLGDVAIPAGEYTLWTLFSEDGGTLIVNSQTGQWGTAYDEAQDFARTSLEQEPVPNPVERFTIGVEGDAGGGRLTLTWDDRRYFVPISAGG